MDARNHDGYTALMVGAWKGHADVVRVLIDAKADLNIKADKGQTSLIIASYQVRSPASSHRQVVHGRLHRATTP